jgi:hypothetical protein
VKATWGRAELLVMGHAPAELDAALAPLRAYILRPAQVPPMSDRPPRSER